MYTNLFLGGTTEECKTSVPDPCGMTHVGLHASVCVKGGYAKTKQASYLHCV